MTDEQRIRDLERELDVERKASNKLEIHLSQLEDRLDKYIDDQKEQEAKKLRTALIWSGGLILALGSFIFSEVIWPVIRAGKI